MNAAKSCINVNDVIASENDKIIYFLKNSNLLSPFQWISSFSPTYFFSKLNICKVISKLCCILTW